MLGLCCLYSVSFLTSNIRVYAEMSREALWCCDLGIQLAVVLWWIWTTRKETNARNRTQA
jgi:hypothetical protein